MKKTSKIKSIRLSDEEQAKLAYLSNVFKKSPSGVLKYLLNLEAKKNNFKSHESHDEECEHDKKTFSLFVRLTKREFMKLQYLMNKEGRTTTEVVRNLLNLAVEDRDFQSLELSESKEGKRYRLMLSLSPYEWKLMEQERHRHSFRSVTAFFLSLLRQTITGVSLLSAPELSEMQKSRSELNRIGINLNQIAKRLNEGQSPDVEDIKTIKACMLLVKSTSQNITEQLEKAMFRHG